jgi:hypothetical protein
MDVTRVNEVRNTIQELFEQVLAEENIVLSRPERQRLFEQITPRSWALVRSSPCWKTRALLKSWSMRQEYLY